MLANRFARMLQSFCHNALQLSFLRERREAFQTYLLDLVSRREAAPRTPRGYDWRERRRGFYTAWEVDMLRIAVALTRADTGWLRQNPQLAERVRPIPNLITERDIAAIRADWAGACEQMHKHGLARAKEVQFRLTTSERALMSLASTALLHQGRLCLGDFTLISDRQFKGLCRGALQWARSTAYGPP